MVRPLPHGQDVFHPPHALEFSFVVSFFWFRFRDLKTHRSALFPPPSAPLLWENLECSFEKFPSPSPLPRNGGPSVPLFPGAGGACSANFFLLLRSFFFSPPQNSRAFYTPRLCCAFSCPTDSPFYLVTPFLSGCFFLQPHSLGNSALGFFRSLVLPNVCSFTRHSICSYSSFCAKP